jgi:hypothetical protein
MAETTQYLINQTIKGRIMLRLDGPEEVVIDLGEVEFPVKFVISSGGF